MRNFIFKTRVVWYRTKMIVVTILINLLYYTMKMFGASEETLEKYF